MNHRRPYGIHYGFTLIELMIVVATVAILASIAYPSYQEHLRKSRRAEAQSALLQMGQFMERYFTTNSCYQKKGTDLSCMDASDNSTPPLPITQVPLTGTNSYYTLTVSAGPLAYTLTATPAGIQTGDKCGNFTLNQAGQRGISGTVAVTDCWRQ